MATYDVTVDTRDMANKMNTVSDKVSNVTKAVATMEAAVIAAEVDASHRVCKRLNKGFLSLVTAQIEQKNATAVSSVEAYGSELTLQREALLDLKERMGDDFLILADRYSKLFNGLNLALHNRVFELDKPLMIFCERQVNVVQRRMNNQIAQVPVNQLESIATTQVIASAHVKRNAEILIGKMKEFLISCGKQQSKMEGIKLNERVLKPILRYIPSIVFFKKSQNGGSVISVQLPEKLGQMLCQGGENKIREQLIRKGSAVKWTSVLPEEQRIISGEFERLLSASDLNPRVKEMVRKMYANNNNWLKTKEG